MTHGHETSASSSAPAVAGGSTCPVAEAPAWPPQAQEALYLQIRVAELRGTLDRVDRSLRDARDAGCAVTARHRRVVADIGAVRRLLGLISARLGPEGRAAH
ncbi:MAG: hypothetical protein SNJ73_08890 [Acetobacteraceae bacterium]